MIGAALYLTVVGLFGLGLGAIVRNTAGGIATFAGDHVRAAAADERAADELEQRGLAVPAARSAGESIISITPGEPLSPVGRASRSSAGYAAAALAIAAVLLVRRDTSDT